TRHHRSEDDEGNQYPTGHLGSPRPTTTHRPWHLQDAPSWGLVILQRPLTSRHCSIKGKDQLAAKARQGRVARQNRGSIEQVSLIDHPAARFGSFGVGDDVWVQVHDEWTDYDGWARVTAWTLTPAQGDQQERMSVSLAPADSFIYGG
ncbi:hypothetical protein, partial [Streptomyces sp. NPDC006668]|uniref:hypothetical protein n=1 Tax=Streptomyces sp. NPDC006668 TaxID=3156903 RepID=UPI0033D4CB8D